MKYVISALAGDQGVGEIFVPEGGPRSENRSEIALFVTEIQLLCAAGAMVAGGHWGGRR